MKKLVATAPRVAALVEYEDRAISANEVKIRVRFGAPKHGTEVVDFRAASPFIDEDFNGEWQMFTPRPADAPRGIEFGKFQLGNMVVGDIIECGSDVTDYAVGDSVCGYGPLSETVIINAVNNYKLRKMPQGSSWKNAVCYDPAQFAMSGVRDANVRVGDFVVVVGLGAIGQIAIQLAKRAGASVVIGVDPVTRRCDIARRHGADFCLNPIGTDVGKEIKTLTGKQGADVIIETSGYADALQSSCAAWLTAAPSPMSRLPNRLPKVLTSDAKRILITPKLSSLARAANLTGIIRAGAASVLKKPVGNC